MSELKKRARSARSPDSATKAPLRDWQVDRNIAFQMARVLFRLDQDLRDTVLRRLDITYSHFRVLQVLYDRDRQTIGEVASATIIRHAVLSRVVDQMEERQLVRRLTDREDNRRTRIELTAKGRAVYERVWPAAHKLLDDAFAVVTPAERETLLALLMRVATHINP